MFDELAQMGEIISCPSYSKFPNSFDDLDPEQLFISWNILLKSETEQENIENVFLFVQEKSSISVTKLTSSGSDKLSEKSNQLKELLSATEIDITAIAEVVSKLEAPQETSSLLKSAGDTIPIIDDRTVDIQETEEITIRVPSAKLDDLMNLVSELITAQGQLLTNAEVIKDTNLTNLSEKFEKLIRQLREQSMEMSLISINTLVVRFKRLARDLSNQLGKQVNLVIEGGETELDKTIIEHLSDPLLHIIRNAIDHGIESVALREAKGKNPEGQIKIRAYYSGAEVHIEVSDDGKGIEPREVLNTAIERKIIQHQSQVSPEEVLKLLFKPGFSTKEEVSEYSGRGVGMDVVHRKINDLRGDVDIFSEPGLGTKILIKLPLTLTIMDGMLTEVEETKYIVPISSVRKIFEINLDELKNSFNNLVTLDGKQYPFLLLAKEFEGKLSTQAVLQLILVEYEEVRMGLVVDRVVGERQVVLKPLGASLKSNKLFSGGSILGDGEIALVLDTNKLIKEFTRSSKSQNNDE